MTKKSEDECFGNGLSCSVEIFQVMRTTYLLLKHQAILQLPGNLNQPTSLGIILRLVDLANSLLQPEERFLHFCVRFRVIVDGRVSAEVTKQKGILAHSLDRLLIR